MERVRRGLVCATAGEVGAAETGSARCRDGGGPCYGRGQGAQGGQHLPAKGHHRSRLRCSLLGLLCLHLARVHSQHPAGALQNDSVTSYW